MEYGRRFGGAVDLAEAEVVDDGLVGTSWAQGNPVIAHVAGFGDVIDIDGAGVFRGGEGAHGSDVLAVAFLIPEQVEFAARRGFSMQEEESSAARAGGLEAHADGVFLAFGQSDVLGCHDVSARLGAEHVIAAEVG